MVYKIMFCVGLALVMGSAGTIDLEMERELAGEIFEPRPLWQMVVLAYSGLLLMLSAVLKRKQEGHPC